MGRPFVRSPERRPTNLDVNRDSICAVVALAFAVTRDGAAVRWHYMSATGAIGEGTLPWDGRGSPNLPRLPGPPAATLPPLSVAWRGHRSSMVSRAIQASSRKQPLKDAELIRIADRHVPS